MIAFLTRHNITHPLISAVAFVIIAFVSGSVIMAASIPLAFYYSRELAHAEHHAHDTMRPWRYVLPWTWRSNEQWDFWPVVGILAILAALWSVL